MTDSDTPEAQDATADAAAPTLPRRGVGQGAVMWLGAGGLWAGLSVGLLKLAPAPFVWIGLLAIVLAGVLAWWHRGTGVRLALVYGSTAVLAVVLYEGWLSIPRAAGSERVHTGSYTAGYFISNDDVFGYRGRPGTWESRVEVDGEVIYDVSYEILPNSLRVSNPPDASPTGRDGVIVYGCSFAFGEGLEDEETLAYQLATQSDGRLYTWNWGFHGWGPHQFLAALQSGYAEDAMAGATPTHVIYLALHDHIRRAAGRYSWDIHGPRFLADADGVAVRHGHFDEAGFDALLPVPILNQLNKSKIWEKLRTRSSDITDEMLRNYVAVIRSARDESRARFGDDVQFTVLVWSRDEAGGTWASCLADAGLDCVYLYDLGLPDGFDHYSLHEQDGHPTAELVSYAAAGLLRTVLAPPASDSATP